VISWVGGGVPWSVCSLAAGSHRSTSLRYLSLGMEKQNAGPLPPRFDPEFSYAASRGAGCCAAFVHKYHKGTCGQCSSPDRVRRRTQGRGEASRIPRLWQPSAGCQASKIAWSSWTSTARYHRSTSNDIAFKQIARNHPTHSVVSSLGLRKLGFDHLEGVGDDRWPRQLSGVVRKVQMKARLIASALEKPQAGRSRPVLFWFPPTSVAQLQYVSAKPTEPAKLPALA